jgi:NTP pyrophosphatase (non-canonical NTP hydrolase)
MLYDYALFVQLKAAPARPIPQEYFNLVHAALGIATEYLELVLSFERHNTEEELGDLLWFLTLAADAIQVPFDRLPTELPIKEQPNLSIRNLGAMVETFVSLVKKEVCYNLDQSQIFTKAFLGLWEAFIYHLQACNFPLSVCISTNQDKLNKRYQATFSQEEAAERKDKT